MAVVMVLLMGGRLTHADTVNSPFDAPATNGDETPLYGQTSGLESSVFCPTSTAVAPVPLVRQGAGESTGHEAGRRHESERRTLAGLGSSTCRA